MIQDITLRPDQTLQGEMLMQPMPELQEELAAMAESPVMATATMTEMAPGTDAQHCTFCGAHIDTNDAFCHECGEKRGSLICPNCQKPTVFSFCPDCGVPLTTTAKQLTATVTMNEDYLKMDELAHELTRLDRTDPIDTEGQIQRCQMNEEFRRHVLALLDEEAKPKAAPITTLQKQTRQEELMRELSQQLLKLAAPAGINRAEARNHQMALRPRGLRSGWICNFKHEEHPSPCACAHPEMGGHWIIQR